MTATGHDLMAATVLKPALGTKKLAKLRASDLDLLDGALRAGSDERRPLAAEPSFLGWKSTHRVGEDPEVDRAPTLTRVGYVQC